MNELRILVVANLPPFVMGGAEHQVARLVECWVRSGHHVEVAGHRIPTGYATLGQVSVRTHRIRVRSHLGRAMRGISYFLSLAVLLRKNSSRFDVIYVRGLGDAALSICFLKRFTSLDLPILACPINARGSGDAAFIRSLPGWRKLVSVIDTQCDAINIIAPAIEHDLRSLGICTPIITRIPNGVPIGPPITRERPPSVRRLVWTGRITRQKGLDLLLDALSALAEEGFRFTLDLVGDGPEQGSLMNQCKTNGLDERVHFVGRLPPDKVREHLHQADAFVLPSRYEGMSNSALEAMEASLPVLLTRCGGIDTYVDERSGWLCEPDNRRALEDALRELLTAPGDALLTRGAHARKIVEQHFALPTVAEQNLSTLYKISKGHAE